MRDSFVLFTEQKEIINKLSDEQAGKIFKALFDYVSDLDISEDIEQDLATDIVFTTLKQTLDRNGEKWEETKQKRSEAGKKGAEKRWQNDGNEMANDGKNGKAINEMAKMAVSVSGSVSVNDNVSVCGSGSGSVINKEPTTAMQFYLNNINSTPVPKEVEILASYQKELPDDLIVYAMEKAVENKARNLGYIKGILNKWQQKGITTLAEAKDEVKNKEPTKTEINKYRDETSQYGDLSRFYANLQEV